MGGDQVIGCREDAAAVAVTVRRVIGGANRSCRDAVEGKLGTRKYVLGCPNHWNYHVTQSPPPLPVTTRGLSRASIELFRLTYSTVHLCLAPDVLA